MHINLNLNILYYLVKDIFILYMNNVIKFLTVKFSINYITEIKYVKVIYKWWNTQQSLINLGSFNLQFVVKLEKIYVYLYETRSG